MSKNYKKADKWYVAGLSFECTGCGGCCSGPNEGYVWVRKAEIELLADNLKTSVEEVNQKYIRKIRARFSLIEEAKSKDCIFLTENGNGKGCAVYDVRPNQCRTWPFWTSNLSSPDEWNIAAMTCPGINRGRYYDFEEIEKLRTQQKWWE
jgi:Fe-S-cluster containining protein